MPVTSITATSLGGGVTLVDSSYVEDPERFSNAPTSNTPYGHIVYIDKMHSFCFGLIKLTAHRVTSYIVQKQAVVTMTDTNPVTDQLLLNS